MICNRCGNQVSEDGFCGVCGAYVGTPVEETTPVPEVVVTDPGKTLGLVSMILGIAALAMGTICSCLFACLGGILPIILAIGGVITGIMAMSKSKAAGFKNTKALVGIILSGATIAVVVVFIIVNAILGGIISASGSNW